MGLDKDLMPKQQTRKSELWSLFKEAKVVSTRAFWHTTKFFVDDTQICPPSFIYECRDQKDLCVVLWNMHGGGVNKLETGVQILKLFKGVDLVLLTET